MSGRDCDIAIVGGGLAGGLVALALAQRRPDLTVRVIEAGTRAGGNHRWSWFASDLDREATRLLQPIRKVNWDAGYEVAFPAFARQLRTPYRSMDSVDFAAALERELPAGTMMARREAAEIDAGGVTLRDGTRVTARSVIDARGFAPSGDLNGGWQVFMGRHMRMDQPHNIARPVIMDARVEQHGGYRFMYLLPLGSHDLFCEDTYYQDAPVLDRSALSARLDEYARDHGWKGQILHSETGLLPVVAGGDFAGFQAANRIAGVGVIGARGGFVHPLTSYTLPFAAQVALAVAGDADLPGDQLAARLEAMARAHWRRTRFYRRLGAMLFGAARPERRYRVFERFYRLPEPLIERFYAGRSTLADRVRILVGRPPVPLLGALRAIATSRPPLLDHKDIDLP